MNGSSIVIKVDQGQGAPVIKPFLPESTSLRGRNYVVIELDQSKFKSPKPPEPSAPTHSVPTSPGPISSDSNDKYVVTPSGILKWVIIHLPSGEVTKILVPLNPDEYSAPGSILKSLTGRVDDKLGPQKPSSDELATLPHLKLITRKSVIGDPISVLSPIPKKIQKTLMIVERYVLSTFLGDFGPGRVIKTFSLFPGEKTRISLSSYKKSASTRSEAASFLDSVSETKADKLQSDFSAESGTKSEAAEQFAAHAEAEAEASWGFGSAKVSGGVSNASQSSREEFVKTIRNFTAHHASESSSKRDVQVNTDFQVTSEEGEQESLERVFENVNVSKTLNFTFRQMNQEYVSILYLFDIRIAYFDEFGLKEVPLYEAKNLLSEVLQNAEDVYNGLVSELSSIKNYKQEAKPFVEEVKEPNPYLRRKIDLVDTYNSITVPGVIMDVFTTVMRTEGVIVDAALGNGDALDKYSQGLQETAVEAKKIDNEMKRTALAIIAKEQDPVKQAELYKKMFVPDTIINK